MLLLASQREPVQTPVLGFTEHPAPVRSLQTAPGQNDPIGHAMHWACSRRPVVLLYVPSAHDETLLPPGHRFPYGQVVHCCGPMLPPLTLKDPIGQSRESA